MWPGRVEIRERRGHRTTETTQQCLSTSPHASPVVHIACRPRCRSSTLPVHVAGPRRRSTPPVHVAGPRRRSTPPVHAAGPRRRRLHAASDMYLSKPLLAGVSIASLPAKHTLEPRGMGVSDLPHNSCLSIFSRVRRNRGEEQESLNYFAFAVADSRLLFAISIDDGFRISPWPSERLLITFATKGEVMARSNAL